VAETVDPITGEVVDEPSMELVPLNLAALDEDELIAMFPTPIQAAGALLHARHVNARAPHALNEYRTALVKAENMLRLALAKTVRDLATEYPRATLTERKLLAVEDERMKTAQDERDTAWLLFEFARDYAKAIAQDIEVLRSLNANFRTEHK
jgi:hypothetical protein